MKQRFVSKVEVSPLLSGLYGSDEEGHLMHRTILDCLEHVAYAIRGGKMAWLDTPHNQVYCIGGWEEAGGLAVGNRYETTIKIVYEVEDRYEIDGKMLRVEAIVDQPGCTRKVRCQHD